MEGGVFGSCKSDCCLLCNQDAGVVFEGCVSRKDKVSGYSEASKQQMKVSGWRQGRNLGWVGSWQINIKKLEA